MTDAEHDMYLQFAVNGRKVLDSAKETFAVWSEKLNTAKEELKKLFSECISTARADGKKSTLDEFQSDIPVNSQETGTQKDGLFADDGAQTELPSLENVSIDGGTAGNEVSPLAQNDGSDIMNEGAQGGIVNGDRDAGGTDAQTVSGVGIIANSFGKPSAMKAVDLLPASIQASVKRFYKGSSSLFSDFSVDALENGNYIVKMTKPGNVPGSKAVYYKEIDKDGNTIRVFKETYDPLGNLVHTKNKSEER